MKQSHCIAWSEVPETVSPSGGKRVIEGAGVSLVA